MARVVLQEPLAEGVFSLRFVLPPAQIEKGLEPGQFFHFRPPGAGDLVLRRPLSLCRVSEGGSGATVVYRVQGEGTRRLSGLSPGDPVDVLGPLGQGFPLHAEDRKALLVGGGIGVPPLVELAARLRAAGAEVWAVAGFASAAQAVLLDELRAAGGVTVLTDDGSLGGRGRVTDALTPEACAGVDRFYACGPTPMLHAVQRVMGGLGVPGYLSLEERMGCGVGLCAGCVHPVRKDGWIKNLKTCRDGPVFKAEEVVFS